MIVKGDDLEEVKQLKQWFNRDFEIKELGKLQYFLGIEVAYSRNGNFVSQQK